MVPAVFQFTLASPKSPPMADASDILDSYLTELDGDFTIEHQEGTNRDKIADPQQMAALIKLKREQEALARRQSGKSVFRQIVD